MARGLTLLEQELIDALRPFADFADRSQVVGDALPITAGSARQKLTMGDCYRAQAAIEAAADECALVTPAMRDRLQAAADLVGARRRAGVNAATIIQELVRDHRATHKTLAWTNTLRVAGVATSCTRSADEGLLENWSRLAAFRLMEPAEGYGHE